jgi:hypothetical protein
MTVATFSGIVSAQAQAGETVQVDVYGPDVDPLYTTTGLTDDTGKYIATIDLAAGDYTAKASVPEDSTYLQAESSLIAFSVTKQTRTITIEVSVP